MHLIFYATTCGGFSCILWMQEGRNRRGLSFAVILALLVFGLGEGGGVGGGGGGMLVSRQGEGGVCWLVDGERGVGWYIC